jgi:hypothetical protein
MNKGSQLYFLIALLTCLGIGFASCNSSSTWGTDPGDYSGTKVSGFALQANDEVLENIDTIYFSVDLVNCKIFNASPLPMGTKIDSLAVTISSDACSVAELRFTDNDGAAQTVDYLTDTDSKINFSNGPVTLHLVSYDGEYQRDYQITINVADAVADSLYWDKLQGGKLYGVPSMQRTKTVKVNDKGLMLSQSAAGQIGISTFIPATKTGGGNWSSELIEPVFTANGSSVAAQLNVDSFTATDNGNLYVTDNNGQLYESTDGGRNFQQVDDSWETISASYINAIIGVKNNAGARTYAVYPESALTLDGQAVSADFPISGSSESALFTTIWTTDPQVIILGGKTASGSYTGASWAFDGSKWAKLSNALPAGSGYSMSRYTIAETDSTTWITTQKDVLIAFGGHAGTASSGSVDPAFTVYVSRDMGLNWAEGSELLQFPDYIPFTTGGSLLVFDKTLDVNSATTQAVTPITSWECPYLYLFGGYSVQGAVRDTFWSGVINHLTQQPLQ